MHADEDWFCSAQCATAAGQSPDGIHEYSRSVTCHGLLDLCHRDAVREADGMALMSMWRINMLRFWSGHHIKYLKVGHRLLAGIYRGCSCCLSNTRHGKNINLPVCVGVCVCVLCLFVCVCVGVSVTLSVNSPTDQTPQRIFTADSLKDADLRKDVPFWSLDDE